MAGSTAKRREVDAFSVRSLLHSAIASHQDRHTFRLLADPPNSRGLRELGAPQQPPAPRRRQPREQQGVQAREVRSGPEARLPEAALRALRERAAPVKPAEWVGLFDRGNWFALFSNFKTS